ncbi:hypothetical protein [Streptomyces sp. 8N706]|uniref:hypothetical protein n=1 Tax=Streptomyces sp. 8N706 TaxID=3457416 RepID=UPI003FD65C8C
MTARVPARRSDPGEGPPKGKSFLEKAAYVVTPGTVVFALLYYFGSTYRSAYYAYFGVRVGDLQLSPQDHVLGSPTAIFLPLLILMFLGLSGLLLFAFLDSRLSLRGMEDLRRQVFWGLTAAGIVLLLLGFPVFLRPRWWQEAVLLRLAPGWPRALLPPLIVALGAILVVLALYLRRGSSRRRERLRAVANGLLVALVAMVVFFDMARYADLAGRAEASQDTVEGFSRMTPIMIHSRQPLPHAPGGCRKFGAGHDPYRYTCTGFRILAKSKAQYFLVPESSQGKRSPTFVLRDDDSIRVHVWGTS